MGDARFAPRHGEQGKEEYNFGTKIVIQEKMADSDSGGEAPVKRGRGRPKGTTKSGEPYVPKEKVPGRGRGRPKGGAAKAPKKPKVMKEFGAGTPKKNFGMGRSQPKYDDFSSDEDDIQEVQFVKMEKGRPRPFAKNPSLRGKAAAKNGGAGKGRGRPPKKRGAEEESNGAPAAKKAKGKKAKPESEEEDVEEAEASEENGAEGATDSDGQDD